MEANLKIRPAERADLPFILSTWLQCYRYDSHLTWHVESPLFFSAHSKVIISLLNRVSTRVWIGCDPSSPEIIFGYLVAEPKRLHFAYVKKALRRHGIFRALVHHADLPEDLSGCEFTHYTTTTKALEEAGKLRAAFNPYDLTTDRRESHE